MVLSCRFEPRFYEQSDRLVKSIRDKPESPIPVPEMLSAFQPRAQRDAFRRRDVRLQSRSFAPLESIADTQPQLQPASLRLSAMISQYFTALILIQRSAPRTFTKSVRARIDAALVLEQMRILHAHLQTKQQEGSNGS